MNMVSCMLCDKKVPKIFQDEAVMQTLYMLNSSPTLVVKDKTPEEVWTGFKPDVADFRLFGCLKLDDKSFRCMLLGIWKS